MCGLARSPRVGHHDCLTCDSNLSLFHQPILATYILSLHHLKSSNQHKLNQSNHPHDPTCAPSLRTSTRKSMRMRRSRENIANTCQVREAKGPPHLTSIQAHNILTKLQAEAERIRQKYTDRIPVSSTPKASQHYDYPYGTGNS